MLPFVEVQKFTTVDELADVVEWGSQYKSLIFLSPCITIPSQAS
jgi:hypothetical protein